ncbi:MAG: hypothetical protein IKU71_06925 [Kiritimatiellae bacterium]|nr:hypothetical protein [Kiritimatiellia bacterium]
MADEMLQTELWENRERRSLFLRVPFESPVTPLDHAADDIGAYGESPDLNEKFDLIEKSGGKYFSELVPNFYAYEK